MAYFAYQHYVASLQVALKAARTTVERRGVCAPIAVMMMVIMVMVIMMMIAVTSQGRT